VQAAHLDEAAEFQPVSLVIAIQRGRRAAFEFARIHGLSSMLEPIFEQGTTQTALVLFDSQVHLVEGFTHDHNAITRELNALRPGDGGAAILDAVNYSVKLLDQISQTSQRVAAADQRDS
jgi:hypothetical protein